MSISLTLASDHLIPFGKFQNTSLNFDMKDTVWFMRMAIDENEGIGV